MRLTVRLGLSCLLFSLAASAQLTTPVVDTSGAVKYLEFKVNTSFAAGVTGATVDVFASCAAGPPVVGVGPSLLKPGNATQYTTTKAGTLMPLLLASPLHAKDPICVLETFTGPAPVPPQTFSATVQPMPAPAPPAVTVPVIEAITYPTEPFLNIDPVKPPAGVTANLDVFASCTDGPPAAGVLPSLIAPGQDTTVDPNASYRTLLLKAAPAANSTLCVLETFSAAASAPVHSVSVTVPSAPQPTLTVRDINTLSLVDQAAAGTTASLYKLSTPYTCSSAAPATPLALAAGASSTLTTPPNLDLALGTPLSSTPIVFCAVDSLKNMTPAYVYLPPVQPVITKVSATSVQVHATSTDSAAGAGAGWTTNVQLLQLTSIGDPCNLAHGVPIALSGSTSTSLPTDASGNVTFTPATSLNTGATICAIQTITLGNGVKQLPPADPASPMVSIAIPVTSPTDWGLVRAYFTGGVVIANDSSNFSSAYQFYELNVDKTWVLPGCPGCNAVAQQDAPPAPSHKWSIGFNSFFDSRLTAIPVSSNPTNTVTTATTTTPATTPATTPSFINTQKTALLAVGVYAPIPLTSWVWNTKQNALFIAPMAKIGFNTLTGATSQNVVLPDSTTSPNTGTETYAQLYNFRTYGARIGHMQYSGSSNQAPEVYSYIDIGFGPYSNLESLICNRTLYNNASSTTPFGPATGQPTATGYTGNGCEGAYPDYYQSPSTSQTYFPYETRKRIYRLDFEGLLQIPGTAFYVGFNANLGQKAVLAGRYDPAFKAPDDLRFFFGTKFDISTVLTKLGVNLGN